MAAYAQHGILIDFWEMAVYYYDLERMKKATSQLRHYRDSRLAVQAPVMRT